MFCTHCGKPLQPNAQFCGSCGQPVKAAPGAHAAPPAYVPPEAPAAPSAAVVGLSRGLSRVLIWNWVGPLKIAVATLGTSLILAVIFGMVTRPYGSHAHWGFKTTYTWLVGWWESTFGVSIVSGATASGSYNGASGSGSAHAGFAAMPLTLTVVTLVVAAFFFRRAIRNSPNTASALLLGVRAALFVAIPLWFFSLFASLSIFDLAKFVGEQNSSKLQTLRDLKSHGIDWSFALTTSSTQAFFIAFLLMAGLFAALTLSRAEWFTGRVMSAVRLCLIAPMRALGTMAIGLVVIGLIFSAVTLAVRATSNSGFHSHALSSLSTHNWVILVFTMIAYSANAGMAALGLGSWGNVGASGSASWSAAIPSATNATGSVSCSIQHGASWWAHNSNAVAGDICSGLPSNNGSGSALVPGLGWGIWTAVILAPILLIFVAWSILKANGVDGKSMLTSLGTWVVSLLAVIPVLSYLAEISLDGNASGNAQGGFGIFSGNASGSASGSIGLAGSTTFLVFAYGLLVALIVGLVSGAINKNSFSGLAAIADQARAQQAAQQAAQSPPAYQPPSDMQPPPYQG